MLRLITSTECSILIQISDYLFYLWKIPQYYAKLESVLMSVGVVQTDNALHDGDVLMLCALVEFVPTFRWMFS